MIFTCVKIILTHTTDPESLKNRKNKRKLKMELIVFPSSYNIFQCVDKTTIKVYLRTSPGISSSFVFTFVFSVASPVAGRWPNASVVGKPKSRKLKIIKKWKLLYSYDYSFVVCGKFYLPNNCEDVDWKNNMDKMKCTISLLVW